MRAQVSTTVRLILFVTSIVLSAEGAVSSSEGERPFSGGSESAVPIIGTYYKVQLTLVSEAQYEKLKDDKAVRGLSNTVEPQLVYVSVEDFDRVCAEVPSIAKLPPLVEQAQGNEPGTVWDGIDNGVAANPSSGEGNSYVDGRDYNYCDGSCATTGSYYAGGVDLDCGTAAGTTARWTHYLPYACTDSYDYLYVGFYGSGTGWPDNGADVLVYRWSSGVYDLVAENVGTSAAWYMYSVSYAIGTYISTAYHNVVIELYASGIDCSRVDQTRVRYYANDKPPSCTIGPTSISFPATNLGSSRTLSFLIRNDGCGTLSGSITETSEHFSVFPASYNLGPGAQAAIEVEFAPQSCGSLSTTINTGAGCANISVYGTCNGPTACELSTSHITMPDTDVGQSSSEQYVITNNGCGTLAGPITESCPDFSISPSYYDLQPGQSETITVTFAPLSCGSKICGITSITGDCGSVTVNGNAPCYGTISGLIVGLDGSSPVAGVTVCANGDSFNGCADSDPDGQWEIANVPYDQCYQVAASLAEHIFEPSSSQCCCNASTPICLLTFTDMANSCCDGRVGDANGSGDDAPTIGDVSIMIDAKFITQSCDGKISCLDEADINRSAVNEATCDDVTIGDISMLIDYLFVTGPVSFGPLPDCR